MFTWPLYAVTARAHHECPFVVLVVTPRDSTARWASQPVELGGGTWRALVVGPRGIPVVTEVDVAVREPHLAVLSVLAHGRDEDVRTVVTIAAAATVGAAGLPEPTRVLYFALIESSLGDAAREAFAMLPQGQRFFSETQRRWFAEGEAKGKAEGEAKGEAHGMAEALLLVLDGRGLAVSAEQRQRILTCTDVAFLAELLKKAAAVETTEQLFVFGPTTI